MRQSVSSGRRIEGWRAAKAWLGSADPDTSKQRRKTKQADQMKQARQADLIVGP